MLLMASTSVLLSTAFAADLVISPVRANQLADSHRAGKLPITIVGGVAGFGFTPSGRSFAGSDADTARTPLLHARAANLIPATLSIPPEREQSIAKKLFTICSEKASADRRAAQKPEFMFDK
jgi:hypothetical protein